MKKISVMMLAMLFCVVSASAQSFEEANTDELVEYTVLEGTAGISNSNAVNLFDGAPTTKWCPYFTKKQEGETTNGAYVIFKSSLPIVPTHYTLTTADDTQTYPARNWKQWQIYGMNAGSDDEATRESENWVVLDKKYNIGQDQLPATNYTSVEFSLSEGNTTPYMYFKIEIDDIFSSTYCMQMADFLLDGITGSIPFADANVKVICVSNWDTDGDGELSMEELASVTSLGETFRNHSTITSFVELQFFTGLSAIADNTFENCSNLTSVTLPKSVTLIGNSAFSGCSSLTKVTIPKSVTTVGSHAFDGCNSLTSVNIPSNITSITDYIFNGCTGLSSVNIPEGVTSIGSHAFNGCSGLTSIAIPESVTSIGEDAFNGCSCLTTVDVKNSTPVAITQNTFSNRSNAILYIPKGSKSAYESATYWNEFMEIISMDDVISFADENVKAICVSNWDTDGDGELSYAEAAVVTSLKTAFRNNSSITSFNELKYFKGLTSIGDYAFYGCQSKHIIIGENVEDIGKDPFVEMEYHQEQLIVECKSPNFTVIDFCLYDRNGYMLSCWRNKEILTPSENNETTDEELELLFNSVMGKEMNKIEEDVYQCMYQETPLDIFAESHGITLHDVITILENFIEREDTVDIDYFIEDYLDSKCVYDIYEYFLETGTGNLLKAQHCLKKYSEDEIRLVRIKYLTDCASIKRGYKESLLPF